YPDLGGMGGAESVVVWTAAGLRRRGHEVRLFTRRFDAGLWGETRLSGADAERVEPCRRGGRLERGLRTGADLAPRLRAFDVLLAHNRYGLLWALPAGAPVCWYCHEPSRLLYLRQTDAFLVEALARTDVDPLHPALLHARKVLRGQRFPPHRIWRNARRRKKERELVARARKVLANSRFNAGNLERALGCSPEVLSPGLPAPAGAAGEGPRKGIAVISGERPSKNLYGVLAAARELERRGALPGEVFHVWGAGTDGPFFRTLLREWGLAVRVVLHGFLDGPSAVRLLARAKLCLFLPLCEPLGLVGVEALVRGVPLLASGHGGPAEVLAACGGGRTVDPLRPDRIADTLEAMFADPEAMRRAAREAAPKAAERFSLERHLDGLEERISAL
ncbi:MAG: glycosyltransferase family 4 protein, partial [Planctomycetota bacterium]